MITIRYKKLKSDKYSIYLDMFCTDETGNRLRTYEFLKLYVDKDYSNIEKIPDKDRDAVFKAREVKKQRDLELSAKLKGIKFQGKSTNNASFIKFIEKEYESDPSARFKTLLYNLKKYLKGKDLKFGEVNPDFMDDFIDWLSCQDLCNNAVASYCKVFRALWNRAINEGLTKEKLFDVYKIPKLNETQIDTLTFDEIQRLINTEFPSRPVLRLAFLFICFTGLRQSDIYALKRKHIEQRGGKLYMKLKPQKTEKKGLVLDVPLTEAACRIVKKLDFESKAPEDKLFEGLPDSRQSNTLLKLWAARAKVSKNMYHHVGRHAFATLCLTYGIDIYVISRLLSHTTVQTTEIYAKLVDEKKRSEVAKLPML